MSAALFSLGIPRDSIVKYETAIKADSFLVLAHGTPDEMARAARLLRDLGAVDVELHEGTIAPVPA
jgi:hypothetical protein